MCEAILSILNERGMDPTINSSFIGLISKKCNAEHVSDYRPICLYNVLYKLVFQTINNRLKPMMNFIISSNQNVFILGRLITYNIMVAHELLHSLKQRNRGKD